MKKKKKQILFLVIFFVCVIGIIAVLIIKNEKSWFPNQYKENERDDTIVYDGKKYKYNDHLSNYLFVGIDTREPIKEYENYGNSGQADAVFFVSYDRAKQTVQCLAIPRDTITTLHILGPDGTDLGYNQDHLSLQYAFGDGKEESCLLMKEAVSTMLYGVPILGYCAINMDGIPATVDVVGDVEVVVPNNSLETVNPEFKEGATVLITKENAEQFVRYRDINVAHSAISRTERQKVFLKAFLQKTKKDNADNKKLIADVYETLMPYMVTNMASDVFVNLVQAKFDSNNGIMDVPGEKVQGTSFDEFHVDDDQLFELVLRMFYKEVQDD